jgi:hypothetical protein
MDKIAKVTYEYQLLRYRHDVASGEFVNIGLVYFDPKTGFLRTQMTEKYSRLSHFYGQISGDFLLKSLKALQRDFLDLGKKIMDKGLIFNHIESLTASILPADDNTLFFSETFEGFHFNHPKAFESLYGRLIGQYSKETAETRHDDHFAWTKVYKQYFDEQKITKYFKSHQIKTQWDVIEFDHAMKNGIWHCVQPLSFDLKKTQEVKDKIYRWSGLVHELRTVEETHHIYLMLLMPSDEQLCHLIQQKLTIKQPNLKVIIVTEQDAAACASELKKVISH